MYDNRWTDWSLLLTDKPVHGSDGGCVAVSPSGRVVCVVGEPDEDAIRAALAEELHATGASVQFAALVFDSCPGSWRSLSSGISFCLATQGASPIGRCAVLACSPLLALALVAGWLASLRCAGWELTDAQTRYLDSLSLYARLMHRSPPKLPVLFLYSTNDALIPFGAVEGMMARLVARSVAWRGARVQAR